MAETLWMVCLHTGRVSSVEAAKHDDTHWWMITTNGSNTRVPRETIDLKVVTDKCLAYCEAVLVVEGIVDDAQLKMNVATRAKNALIDSIPSDVALEVAEYIGIRAIYGEKRNDKPGD